MARLPDPTIREKILDACACAALQSGMRDLSLLGLAKETKVSRRMLIYHFGSVETLLEETVARVATLLRDKMHTVFAQHSSSDTRQMILTFWQQCVAPGGEQTTRAYFHLHAECVGRDSNKPGLAEFSRPGWLDWAKVELAASTPRLTDAELTLLYAIMRGLLLDYWTTKDLRGTTAALNNFLTRYNFENEP